MLEGLFVVACSVECVSSLCLYREVWDVLAQFVEGTLRLLRATLAVYISIAHVSLWVLWVDGHCLLIPSCCLAAVVLCHCCHVAFQDECVAAVFVSCKSHVGILECFGILFCTEVDIAEQYERIGIFLILFGVGFHKVLSSVGVVRICLDFVAYSLELSIAANFLSKCSSADCCKECSCD